MLNKLNLDGIFFLSEREKVDNLEVGARMYGGATLFENGVCISGVQKDSELIVNNKVNTIVSLFIPSTLNVDTKIDNSTYVARYKEIFEKIFKTKVAITKAQGSWVDENSNVVIEEQTLLSVYEPLGVTKYNKLVRLARKVKKEMQQEGVTITLDNAFLIV